FINLLVAHPGEEGQFYQSPLLWSQEIHEFLYYTQPVVLLLLLGYMDTFIQVDQSILFRILTQASQEFEAEDFHHIVADLNPEILILSCIHLVDKYHYRINHSFLIILIGDL